MTLGSDTVGNGGFHAIEEEDAAENDGGYGSGGSGEKRAGRLAVSRDGPAEAVDNAGHGIEAVEPAPSLRNEGGGVGDRGGEHPELDEEWRDVLHVAIEGVESGHPKADAESGGDGKKQKHREPESGGARANAVDGGDDRENEKADREVNKAGKDGRDWEDESREIDFGDNALVVDDDVCGGLKGGGEVRPSD